MNIQRYGIDISYANKKLDFKKIKEGGVSFAIIRTGYRQKTDCPRPDEGAGSDWRAAVFRCCVSVKGYKICGRKSIPRAVWIKLERHDARPDFSSVRKSGKAGIYDWHP